MMLIPDAVLSAVGSNSRSIDESATFPRENLDLLGAAGLMGLLIPTEFGGRGSGPDQLVEVAQLLAARCLSTAMIWAMHQQQVDAIVRHATPKLQRAVLPAIASGEIYIASVTTDPKTGSDPRKCSQPLRRRDDGWLDITRYAPVVTGGMHADAYLITMAEPDDPSAVSLVYADTSNLRVEELSRWEVMGMRGTDSRGILLTGRAAPWARLGSSGRFREVSDDSFVPIGHLAWSACWLGAARGALERLVRHLSASRANALGDVLRDRIARIRIDLEIVAATLASTCTEFSDRRRDGRSATVADHIHLSTLKVVASERALAAVDAMVVLAGLRDGYSTSSELRLEQALRDLRSAALNFHNDRLLAGIGAMSLLDRRPRLLGDPAR